MAIKVQKTDFDISTLILCRDGDDRLEFTIDRESGEFTLAFSVKESHPAYSHWYTMPLCSGTMAGIGEFTPNLDAMGRLK